MVYESKPSIYAILLVIYACIFLIEFMNGSIKFVLPVVECHTALGRIERTEVSKTESVVVLSDTLRLTSLSSIKGRYSVSVIL